MLLRLLLWALRGLGWTERPGLDLGALREAREAGVVRLWLYPGGALRRVDLLPLPPAGGAGRGPPGAGGPPAEPDGDPLWWASGRRPAPREGARR